MFFFVDDFFVRKSGQRFRVPVHHTDPAIDQAFIEQIYEYLDNTFTTFFVHSKGSTIPVAGCAELAKLFQDNTSMFVRPVPSVLQELVTSQVGFLDTLRG